MQSQGFLQSNEWAGFQRSLGREVFEYPNLEAKPPSDSSETYLGAEPPSTNGIRAIIIKHDLPFGKNYLYIPHGPEIDFNQMTGGFKNPVANFVRWLREEGKKRKSIFIKAEPLVDSVAQALVESGFRKSKKKIQPNRTVIIDLDQDDNELLGRMHHKTRYNIKVAESHGVKVVESNDLDTFLKLLKKTTKRDKFSPHPADYYKKLFNFDGLQTKLYFAGHSDRPIAAALVLIYGDTAYYLHGASDYKYRSLMAPYALHWYIITSNQKLGTRYYDLWGIDANKWPGVTRFKLGWGGQTIEHSGSFDLPVSKFWHLIYKVAKRF